MPNNKWGINTDDVDRERNEAINDFINQANNENNVKSIIATIDNPIDYVEKAILKEAKREERLVKQLLITMLSSKTNNPLNIGINAPSGEGKNWAIEKVAAVFPEEDVYFIHGMTDKALLHESGELVIKDTDLDFVSFKLELDESEKDNFGYYRLSYVESQIEQQGENVLSRQGEPNSKAI